MALSKFKYVPSKDTGVNPDKSVTLYGHVFPAGKEVEVPESVARKLRTKAGREGDEFVEVSGPPKTEAELQREKEIKAESKDSKKDEKLTPEQLDELKAKAAKEDARVAQVQNDAKLGR